MNKKIPLTRIPLKFLFVLALISNASCRKFVSLVTPLKQTQTYTVAQGQKAFTPYLYEDYSGLTSAQWVVRLNADTLYASPLAQEGPASSITQVNKLIGVTDCGKLSSGIGHNSALFGWAYYGGKMRIYPFVNGAEYANGFSYGLFADPLAIVQVNHDYLYILSIVGSNYQFTVQDNDDGTIIGTRLVARTQCSGSMSGVALGPYFGGNIPAPQSMSMEITIK